MQTTKIKNKECWRKELNPAFLALQYDVEQAQHFALISYHPNFRQLTIFKVASNIARNKQLISAGGELLTCLAIRIKIGR